MSEMITPDVGDRVRVGPGNAFLSGMEGEVVEFREDGAVGILLDKNKELGWIGTREFAAPPEELTWISRGQP